MEHVPGLGLKHDKTLSFGTQELHTAQKRRSGLLSAWEGRGEAQEQWRVWGNAGPERAAGRGTHPLDHGRVDGLSPHDLLSQGGKEAAAGPQLAEEPGPTRAQGEGSFLRWAEGVG